MTNLDLAAIVLAGGRAQRMGGEKILAPFAGATVLDRVLTACGAAEIIVVGPPELAAHALAAAARLVREDPPFSGPVAGLRAGLAALPERTTRVVAVLAGDQPHLDPEGLADLRRALAQSPMAQAAAYVADDGHRQFLCALWREPALRARAAAAGTSMRSLYAEAAVVDVADPRGVARDVDTPADLAAARARRAIPPRG